MEFQFLDNQIQIEQVEIFETKLRDCYLPSFRSNQTLEDSNEKSLKLSQKKMIKRK
jgi:hypothetical protein